MISLKEKLLNRSATELVDLVIANGTLRGMVLKIAEKKLYQAFVENNDGEFLDTVQLEKYYVFRNMFRSIDKALRNRNISSQVRRGLLKLLVGQIILKPDPRKKEFEAKYGWEPPGFLTISPTKLCNLHCTGCYADSSGKRAEKLPFDIVDRLVREKTELWGSHFTVISGGEPLMYDSDGKDVLDLSAKHQDNFFLMYTNGTLIDEKTASKMAECGNITPAISVEGFEKQTDARRGKGVFKKILKAFENLRKVGVPFGISMTITRENADLALSDEVVDFFFHQEGAIYGWIFQYMPIGRSYTLDLLVTPEQRTKMYEMEQRLVKERSIFVADFWNSGPISNGCISAGRSGGYFYIDWNGNVLPCVFTPYYTHNIIDIYKQGGDLNTALNCRLFQTIRKWQKEYSYKKPLCEVGNQIVPCPYRDHHKAFREAVKECNASPADQEAAEALKDEEYAEGLACYGSEVAHLTDGIWEKQYLQPEKKRVANLKK